MCHPIYEERICETEKLRLLKAGSPEDNDMGSRSGSVYLFRTNGSFIMKLTAPDGAASDYFGRIVSLSGNTVAVGSSYFFVSWCNQ